MGPCRNGTNLRDKYEFLIVILILLLITSSSSQMTQSQCLKIMIKSMSKIRTHTVSLLKFVPFGSCRNGTNLRGTLKLLGPAASAAVFRYTAAHQVL